VQLLINATLQKCYIAKMTQHQASDMGSLNLSLGKFCLFKQLAQLLMKWQVDKMFKHQASADFKVRSSYRFGIFSGWCN
jgi:hypothetical protein